MRSSLGRVAIGRFTAGSLLWLALASLSVLAQDTSIDLSVTSVTPSTGFPLLGANFTYTITVTRATGTGTGGVVTQVLPANVTFVSGTAPGGSCTGNCGTVICPMGSITGSTSAVVTVTATTLGLGLTIAGVAGNEWDQNLSNNSNTATVTVSPGPTVTSITPAFKAQKPSSSYTATLTIAGQNFQTGATVTIPNVTCPVTSLTSTQIQCSATIPAASATIVPGFRNVTVTPTSGQPGVLPNGFDLRRFADITGSDPFGLGIWKSTTAYTTMYDVVTLPNTDGITNNGDGTQNFNPATTVQRRDMARYILRARGATASTGCTTPTTFCDVACSDPDWGWIERFYDDGFTAGCASAPCTPQPSFCPNDNVLRNQMALFIEKGLNHTGSTTPCNAQNPAYFGDVPCADPFWKWIQQFYEDGITAGCQAPPNPLFCPTNPVPRNQMAVFIANAWAY